MKSAVSILSLLALSCLVWQCTPSLQYQGSPDSVTYKQELDMRVMGVKRNYWLHVPANYNPQEQAALVVVIHGAFSTARKMEMESGLSAVADREGFLVAYPSGAYGIFGLFQHWNAGHCCGKAASDGVDDVAFLDAVIDDISQRFHIDTRRIYMAGFSNGGMLTYLYSAERTHRLAAAAILAATLGGRSSSESSWWQTPQPSEPLPMIIFHGLDDTVVPYKGGVSPRKGGQREYVSVPDSVQFWVENNNCRKNPIEDKLYGGRITRKSWADIQGENRVVLYSIDNWGHEWPGPFFTGEPDKNDTFRNFNAADLIWDFFQQ